MRPEFGEMMSGQITSDAAHLEPTPDHAVAVLALDRDGRFGAAFLIGLAVNRTFN